MAALIPSDTQLDRVVAWLRGKPLRKLIASAARRAIDEVVDGPRTGRWAVDQLEKTEKTYIGTRMEILVRTALGLRREKPLDAIIEGEPVDFKWSLTSQWEFPREAVGMVCLLIGTNRQGTLLNVGVVRPLGDDLNRPNRDGKRTLSASGRQRIRWLETEIPLEPNFLATLPALDVMYILAATNSGQERIRRLFEKAPLRVVPRAAIETVAQQKDPMRRVRKDRGNRLGGVVVLSGKYQRDQLRALGFPDVAEDEFVAFPASDLPDLQSDS